MYRNDSPANDSPIKSRHNPPSRQEISTAQSRVSALKEALEGMLTGDKPYIDLEDPLLGFLFEQLEIMHAGGFLMEPPRSYCLKEDELSLSETKMALKGVTRLEPMPKALTTESKELELALKALDVHNAKVLGKDYGFRYRRPLSEQLDYADSFVLPRAGLVGLYQFVSYLSEMRSNPAALRNKQFIIQNTEDFWRPVVRALSPLIEETPNFTLTETAHSTAAHLDSALGVRKKIVARNDETVPILGPGHQILLLTSNPKKQNLYKKAAALRPDGVLMKDFASVFPEIPRGADELAYSYTGNVLDKLQALYNMVAEIGPAPYRKALRKRGLAPEAVSILIDDQGVEVDASLFAGDEFPAIAAERWNDYRSHLPGPETKGLFSALPGSSFNGKSGDEAFVSRLFSARDRIYADLPPQDRPRIQDGKSDTF